MTSPRPSAYLSLPVTIRDDQGRDHRLTSELGSGNQGVVYTSENPEIAVKLHAGGPESLPTSLKEIRLLPLSALPMARPLSTISDPMTGYTMQLMPDLMPWSALWDSPEQGLGSWWIKEGGLRRRLSLASSLARTMTSLSALGITYGDLSPANALITGTTAKAQGCILIDLDNLRQGPGPAIATPRYGAPELIRYLRHNGPPAATSSLTDVWSLAVLTFTAICLVHPLLGAEMLAGPADAEEMALAGHLPWIDDDDQSNGNPNGMPRQEILTKELRARFAEVFGPGRLDARKRPSAAALLRSLEEQKYLLADCPNCRTDWVARGACLTCRQPMTDHRLWQVQSVPFSADARLDADAPLPSAWLATPNHREITPPRRLVAYGEGESPLSLEFTDDEVALTRRSSDFIWVSVRGRAFQELGEHKRAFSANQPLVVRIGEESGAHRLLVLQGRR